jgi:hypothetical protein
MWHQYSREHRDSLSPRMYRQVQHLGRIHASNNACPKRELFNS